MVSWGEFIKSVEVVEPAEDVVTAIFTNELLAAVPSLAEGPPNKRRSCVDEDHCEDNGEVWNQARRTNKTGKPDSRRATKQDIAEDEEDKGVENGEDILIVRRLMRQEERQDE